MNKPAPLENADKPARPGKGWTLQARITGELRAALEAEADRTGRSMSEVAALWLEIARGLQGRGGVADAIRSLIDFAAAMEAQGLGDPTKDNIARETLIAGWQSMIARALPYAPLSKEEFELLATNRTHAKACAALATHIEGLPDDHKLKAAASVTPNPYAQPINALSYMALQDRSGLTSLPLIEMLKALGQSEGRFSRDLAKAASDRLEQLAEAGVPIEIINGEEVAPEPFFDVLKTYTAHLTALNAVYTRHIDARERSRDLLDAMYLRQG